MPRRWVFTRRVISDRRRRGRQFPGLGRGRVQPGTDGGVAPVRTLVQSQAWKGASGVFHIHQRRGQPVLLVRVPASVSQQVPHAPGPGARRIRSR